MSKIKKMKIAITGSMASGKSTCSNIIRDYGYYVFDSDLYAKTCYEKEHLAYKEIINLLGEDILDSNGEVVLKKVSDLIFNNNKFKKELEGIIHPYVKEEIIKESKNHKIFFAEVPLLFEAKLEEIFDYVLLIVSNEENIVERSIKYRNYTKEEAINRLKSQMDIAYKIERSNYVLYNDKTLKEFKDSVYSWMKEMNLING